MTARTDVRRVAPWVLCGVALGMYVVTGWLRWLVRDQGPDDHVDWVDGIIETLGFAGIPVVGALIAARQPANPYGWIWCGAGLAYGVAGGGGTLVKVIGAPAWVTWLLEGWGFVSLICLLTFVFLLFPTGRLPSYRWRWVARAVVIGALLLALAAPFVFDPTDPTMQATPWALRGEAGRHLVTALEAGVYGMFGLALLAMASLVLRFRRAGPVQRRQLTWFLYAAALNGGLLVLDAVGLVPENRIGTAVSAVGFALLPVAVGVAMLRYRLYEIDRIVSRTVSYGVLTGGLVVLYLGLVTLLRPLLEPLTGSSALAVAGSTLAVAAVFNPARRRLQSAVDRRFDRARYDAVRAVDAFAARLRNQVDLDEITAGLRDTVTQTVAPGRVSVWLRPGRG